MFDNLSDKLQKIFKNLRGQGKLTEANIREALREVRMALLEADVHYKVAKDFVASIAQRAVGQEVMQSLTPGQQVIKIVNEELTALMGGAAEPLKLSGRPPVAVMLVGLQGSGKTTTAGKLARKLSKDGRRPCLVPADVYRPAAIDQLITLAGQLKLPVYPSTSRQSPEQIAKEAVNFARQENCDTLLVDTAGRLHIDAELMEELSRLKDILEPSEILLVADAMTGQDAVQIAGSFNEKLGLTGIILTKLDGDARGGAALSIRSVTHCPIKLIGVGEKLDALEVFHPDRMSSRILGMGDVLSMIEKAQEAFDVEQAQEIARKFKQNTFTLEDFLVPAPAGEKNGFLRADTWHASGYGDAKRAEEGPGRSERVRAHGGHHQFHDQAGAQERGYTERKPQAKNCRGERHERSGRKSTSQEL